MAGSVRTDIVALIGAGSAALKAVLGWPGGCCRFKPACSAYAGQVLQQQPLQRAVALIAWRLLRCGPWSVGGYDPPPAVAARATGERGRERSFL